MLREVRFTRRTPLLRLPRRKKLGRYSILLRIHLRGLSNERAELPCGQLADHDAPYGPKGVPAEASAMVNERGDFFVRNNQLLGSRRGVLQERFHTGCADKADLAAAITEHVALMKCARMELLSLD